jgi:arylsulfatase A-like enzyme
MMRDLTRRDFLRYVSAGACAGGFALGSGTGWAGESAASKRPNVLWIMMDDCRADAVGCYGKPWARTPNMDACAKRGVRFDVAIIQNPVCIPSRSSMKTGLYCHELGIMNMGKPPAIEPAYARTARRDAPNLVNEWKKVGITPVSVGKRHAYEKDWDHRGDVEGEVSYLGEPKSEDLKRRIEESGRKYPAAITRTHKWAIGGILPLKPEEMDTSRLGDLAVDTLHELTARDEPFFLRVSFHAPHVPCRICESYFIDPAAIDLPLPTEEELKSKPKFERVNIQVYAGADLTVEQIGIARGTYYGMVSLVDAQVGRLVEVLKKSGKLDNTVIVINSDQGFQLGEHGFWKKRCFYEQNVRVPLIISCPRLLPADKVIAEPVEMVDFMPTLMQLSGLDIPFSISGKSMMPLIEGKVSTWKEACFCEHDYSGDMYDELRKDGGHCVMVRTKEWKLIYFKDERLKDHDGLLTDSLYDLQNDAGETRNLYGRAEYESVVQKLKESAQKWEQGTLRES